MERNSIILRNNIEFNIHATCDAFDLNNAIIEWYNELFLPLLNKVISEIDDPEYLLRIEELNIDLDLDFSTSFLQGLEKKLMEEIIRQIPIGSMSVENADNIIMLPSRIHFWEVFIFYLENGFLPWQSTLNSGRELLNELSEKFEKVSREEIRQLKIALCQIEASKRFINLVFSDPDFRTMLGKISGNLPEFGPQSHLYADIALLSGLIQLNAPTPLEKRSGSNTISISKKIYQKLLTLLSKQSHEASAVTILKELLPEYISQIVVPKSELLEMDFKSVAVRTVLENIISTKKDYQEKGKTKSGTENKSSIGKAGEIDLPTQEKQVKALLNNRLEEAAKQGIFINNAGFIIVAPFLPALFEKTGLLSEGKINQTETAISLCYYLLNGHTNYTEFELPIIKILCGLPLNKAVPNGSELSDNMKNEANELLNAIITHWQVLKGTSTEGLREAFFYRNGKIVSDYNSWHLRVEQKPYDMLLQKLPWNITMIKLSWMKKVLMTEWS